jgi:inorganic pyrophosphatase
MKLRFLVFLALPFIIFSSCSESSTSSLKSENGFYQIEVTEAAGSRVWKNLKGEIDTLESYLKTPVNMGEFPVSPMDSLNDRTFIKAFILNNNDKVGEVMEVYPVAVLKMLDGERSIPFMLVVPKDADKRLVDVRSLYELQKKCYACKSIMEEWVSNLPSQKELVFFGWENEQRAERLLDEYSEAR